VQTQPIQDSAYTLLVPETDLERDMLRELVINPRTSGVRQPLYRDWELIEGQTCSVVPGEEWDGPWIASAVIVNTEPDDAHAEDALGGEYVRLECRIAVARSGRLGTPALGIPMGPGAYHLLIEMPDQERNGVKSNRSICPDWLNQSAIELPPAR
jgi:hypothetical protein